MIKNLGKLHHERVLETLSPLLTKGQIPTRIAAARELAGFCGVDGTSKKLLEAYDSNKDKSARGVRITILRALGELKSADAIDLVNRLIPNEDEWIAKAAIDAAGKIRQKSSVDALIKEYRRMEGREGNVKLGADPIDLPSSSTNLTDVIRGQKEAPTEKVPTTRGELLIPAIQAALVSITKQDWKGIKDWEAWWAKAKSKFQVPK